MKRRPSLNVYIDLLHKTLSKSLSLSPSKITKIINEVIKESKEDPVKRHYIVTSKKIAKNLHSIDSLDTELFNRILISKRSHIGHKGARIILKGDKLYNMLSDISNDAKEFCTVFEISDINKGMTIYCELGLAKIGRNYGLNKFKTYKDYIFLTHERQLVIDNDSHLDFTVELAYYYVKKCNLIEETQMINIQKAYAHDFVYAADQCLENKASCENWINAQFKGMAYLEAIPEPYQLHGEEAQKRYLLNAKVTQDDWRTEALKRKKENENQN